MSVVLGFAVGFLAVRLAVLAGARTLAGSPALARENYRARRVTTAGGLFVVLAVLVVEGSRTLLGGIGAGPRSAPGPARLAILVACLGFGLLGFLDDVVGADDARGFGGHLRALTGGRVTTGAIKLVGGAAVAIVAVAVGTHARGLRLLLDAALVALAANTANLLDRAPGRLLKVAIVAYVPVAVALGTAPAGPALAVVLGAAAGLAAEDLGERLMLGDTGSNVIGAALGLGVVLGTSPGTRDVVLVVLAGLNLVAERVSFSSVIERVPPLRAADRWGRRRPGRGTGP